MTDNRMYESKNLPTARYVACSCPKCKQNFTYDKGVSHDRHEYLTTIHENSIQCPTCLSTLKVPTKEYLFGYVEN